MDSVDILGVRIDDVTYPEALGILLQAIASHVPHKAEALEATLDVDIFCPPRQDWLDGSDAYLR